MKKYFDYSVNNLNGNIVWTLYLLCRRIMHESWMILERYCRDEIVGIILKWYCGHDLKQISCDFYFENSMKIFMENETYMNFVEYLETKYYMKKLEKYIIWNIVVEYLWKLLYENYYEKWLNLCGKNILWKLLWNVRLNIPFLNTC